MAGKDTPMWRQAFNKAERAVGEPLEKAIDTRQFADAMSIGAKVRRTVQRQIYGAVNKTLHFWGLSTLKDTREITRQLNRVQGQLRELSTQLEYLEEREQAREAEDAERSSAPGDSAPAKPATTPSPAQQPAAAKKSAPAAKKSASVAKKAAPAKKSAPARKSAPAKKTSAPTPVSPSPTPPDAVRETGDRPTGDTVTTRASKSTGDLATATPAAIEPPNPPAGELTTGQPDSTQGA